MQKKCLKNHQCPLTRGYDAIGDWWSLLIMTRIVLGGMRRFSEIQEDLGVAKNILTSRLKKLVEQGLLEREPLEEGGAYHGYVPTPKGQGLFTALVALRQWGETHFFEACETQAYQVVDRTLKQVIPPIEVRSADGRVLGPSDLEIITAETAVS